MSTRAPHSGPLREARSCYDHLAGRLGVALAATALHRGWILDDGDAWRLAEDAAQRATRDLGLQVDLDPTSVRPAVRRCQDWTEHRPHLAGGFGAALFKALLASGWVQRIPDARALTITSRGAESLRRSGVRGIVVDDSGCDADNLCISGAVSVTAAGGEDWDALVERAVAEGWTGVSALAGLGGSVADAVASNLTAYGQCVGDVVASVRTWDREVDAQRTFAMVDCEFRPGRSRFTPRADGRAYAVLEVTFLFRSGTITAPLTDPALVQLLGVQPGMRLPLSQVRRAVLAAAR